MAHEEGCRQLPGYRGLRFWVRCWRDSPAERFELDSKIDGVHGKMLRKGVLYWRLCLYMAYVESSVELFNSVLTNLWVSFQEHTLAKLFTDYCPHVPSSCQWRFGG